VLDGRKSAVFDAFSSVEHGSSAQIRDCSRIVASMVNRRQLYLRLACGFGIHRINYEARINHRKPDSTSAHATSGPP
jgi:hypothetical protein